MKDGNSYSWGDYANDIIQASMPWIAFAGLALLAFIIVIVAQCVTSICCKNKIKKRGELFRNICTLSSFVLTFLALGCCAYVLHYSDAFYESFQQTQCSAGRIPYVIENGNLGYKWMGLEAIYENTTYIRDFLKSDYANYTNSLWQNTDWITLLPLNFYFLITQYYANYTLIQVPSPNFNSSSSISLNYIYNLGPPSSSSTQTGLIFEEYKDTFGEVLIIIYALKNLTLEAEKETGTIILGLNEAEKDIKQFRKGNNEVMGHIDDWIINNQDTVRDSWKGFTMVIVIWGWLIGIGAILTIASQALDTPRLAKGLCAFWIFTGLFSIIGFVLCIALLSAGIVTVDTCGLLDELFTKEGLEEYSDIIPDEIVDYLNACLNENGNIDKYFSLNQTLSIFSQTEQYYLDLQNLTISSSMSNFTSITENQQNINSLLNYIDIEASDVSKQDTSSYNLNELNKYANNYTENTYQTDCTKYTSDLWVFNTINCAGYPYINSTITDENLGKKCCLVIFEWTEKSVKSRYSPYLSCANENILDNLINTQTALLNFGNSVNTVFKELNQSLPLIQENINILVNNLIPLNEKINLYFTDPNQLGEFYSMIYGPSGFLNGLNCSFAYHYSRTLRSTVCDNTLESMYQIYVYIFVLSFLLLIMEFMSFYLGKTLPLSDESITN